MHLIESLAAGIRGAENGSAEIYVHGATNRATYWRDFEATLPIADGADVALNANGAAVVYVGQVVRVVVKDIAGNAISDFVVGSHAGAVEVISQSATGVDYSSGARGTLKPTTLQAVIDAWFSSAGAPDAKVLLGGVATNLSSALYSLGGGIVNVKDPAFGAKGNGVTYDTTAINNAIDTAAAMGGGGLLGGVVYFPPGLYRTSGTISVDAGVSLIGAGPDATEIINDSGAGHVLSYVAPALLGHQTLSNMSLLLTSGAGSVVEISSLDASLLAHNVTFISGAASTAPTIRMTVNSTSFIAIACQFLLSSGNSQNGIQMDANWDWLVLVACKFVARFAQMTGKQCIYGASAGDGNIYSFGNIYDFSAVNNPGAAPGAIATNQATGDVTFIGNKFIPGAAGTAAQAFAVGPSNTDMRFFEFANAFGTDAAPMDPWALPSTTARRTELTREFRHIQQADAGTAVLTLNGTDYGKITIQRTSAAAAQTLNIDSASEGDGFTLVYWNDDAVVTGTITWGANIRAGAANFTVNANSMSIFRFEFRKINGNHRWVATSAGNANVAE